MVELEDGEYQLKIEKGNQDLNWERDLLFVIIDHRKADWFHGQFALTKDQAKLLIKEIERCLI